MPSKDFLALNPGFSAADMLGANRRRTKRSAPGLDSPARAARGEGDRVRDLMTLAAAGWVRTNCQDGQHWLTHCDGREGARCASYRAMLDIALEEIA